MSDRTLKMMAFVCKICPPCIFARKYPEAKFSKFVEKEKKICPFCKAYDEAKEKGMI